jgi:hypothetical protein
MELVLNTLKNLLNNMNNIIKILKRNVGLKIILSVLFSFILLVSYNITGHLILLRLSYIPLFYLSIIILMMVIYIISYIINGK